LVRAPARKTEDPGTNSGPGVNCPLKLNTQDLPEGNSEKKKVFKHRIPENSFLLTQGNIFRPHGGPYRSGDDY
jgi:hypothetical protein